MIARIGSQPFILTASTTNSATDLRALLLEVYLIVERPDRIAAADGAALLDPAIETGPIV